MTVSSGREFERERHYSMLTWILVVMIVGVVFSWIIKRIINEISLNRWASKAKLLWPKHPRLLELPRREGRFGGFYSAAALQRDETGLALKRPQ